MEALDNEMESPQVMEECMKMMGMEDLQPDNDNLMGKKVFFYCLIFFCYLFFLCI